MARRVSNITVGTSASKVSGKITLSKFATKADKEYAAMVNGTKKSNQSSKSTYTEPPGFLDTNPAMTSGSIGSVESGGYKLDFIFTTNMTLTVPKTGTLVVGSGGVGYVPQFSDANTLENSNLKMTGSNVLTLAASGTSTATVPWTGNVQVGKIVALTPSAAVAWDCATGNIATLVPDQNCSITPSNMVAGLDYTLIITTSGTSSRTLTFASPFKVTGTLATGATNAKVFVVTFISDGATLYEQGRTTAM